ncbi:MAG: hypothetical protein IJ565_00350 [Bacilli bacterium]|nr:hypothetical protein [Bacilli bacterium]
MVSILNAEARDGMAVIQYIKDGKTVERQIPFRNADGSINPAAQDALTKAWEVMNIQNANIKAMDRAMEAIENEKVVERRKDVNHFDEPEERVIATGSERVAPSRVSEISVPGVSDLEVNPRYVNKPPEVEVKHEGLKALAKAVVLGVAAYGIVSLLLTKCGADKEVEEPKPVEETVETNEDDLSSVLNTVNDLSVEDVEKLAYDASKFLNGDLGLGISQQSINSTVFIMNQENGIDEEETKELIESGFIASDPADVFPATLETTNVINKNNALTTEDPNRSVISYAVFTADERTKELCDAFVEDTIDNQEACAVLNSSTATKEEKEAARKIITANWTSFKQYGGIEAGKTDLPYDVNQGSIASQWVSLQQLQPYSVAAGKAGVSQKDIDFASGIGKNSSVVFVDFASMYNLTAKNLGKAQSAEFALCEVKEDKKVTVASPKTGQDEELTADLQRILDEQNALYAELQSSQKSGKSR